ncbi:hypothetical protein OS493_030729 [Desmophyllum pertusum]|uniref:Uncharacterized protein n=1 Tax=Desmophyllum pertusum TaxID=174260 RepID=A0A9W9Z9W6_9CNID|nr:hypothetical protein OS493_030729 [Desmophyllum pertusum]
MARSFVSILFSFVVFHSLTSAMNIPPFARTGEDTPCLQRDAIYKPGERFADETCNGWCECISGGSVKCVSLCPPSPVPMCTRDSSLRPKRNRLQTPQGDARVSGRPVSHVNLFLPQGDYLNIKINACYVVLYTSPGSDSQMRLALGGASALVEDAWDVFRCVPPLPYPCAPQDSSLRPKRNRLQTPQGDARVSGKPVSHVNLYLPKGDYLNIMLSQNAETALPMTGSLTSRAQDGVNANRWVALLVYHCVPRWESDALRKRRWNLMNTQWTAKDDALANARDVWQRLGPARPPQGKRVVPDDIPQSELHFDEEKDPHMQKYSRDQLNDTPRVTAGNTKTVWEDVVDAINANV